jgi:putative endonuclease
MKRMPRGWCVYLVRCRDGSLYAGATNDLAARVERHNAGRGAAYTRSRRPVQLAWFAAAKDRSAALRREARIKKLSRAQKLLLVGRSPRNGRPPGPFTAR